MAHRMTKETHDIPEWAIYYLAYGECDGLTEEEVDMLTAFIEFNFPLGYTMEGGLVWNRFCSTQGMFGKLW